MIPRGSVGLKKKITVLDHFLLIGSCTETRWPGLNFVCSLGSVHLLLFLSALFAASSRACMSISAFSAWAGSIGIEAVSFSYCKIAKLG